MSETIDRIKAHFDSLGVREISVPEWGITLFSTPVTVAERHRIYRGVKSENDYEILVSILIEKAQDKEGKKLFTIADRPALLQRAASDVLIRVAAEIMNGVAPPATELKN